MGIPAIFMAAVAPSEETVVALVESGADVGHIVSGNLTVLHICAEHGMCDAVSAIVSTETGKRTAEVENSDGNKPLHLAAMGSHEAIIRILAPYSGSLPSVYFVGGVLGADLCMDAILSDGKLRLDEWMSTHRSSNQPKESKMEADTAAMNSDVNGEPVDLTSPVTAEKISECEEHKARGNKHFNAGRFEEAASAYSEAINSNPMNHTLWSNRSACYLSQVDAIVQSQSAASSSSFLSPSSSVVQELKEKALKDAEICRRIKPDWPKGCFRLASARLALDMFEEAAVAAYEGCQLDDNSLELKSLLKKAVKMGQEQYRKSQEQNNKSK
jgi:ankyrin repeat protein